MQSYDSARKWAIRPLWISEDYVLENERHVVLLPVLNTFLPFMPVASVVEMVKTTWRPHKTCVSSREGISSNRDGIGFSKHLLVVLRQSQSCGPRGSIVLVTLSKQCCHGTGRFSLCLVTPGSWQRYSPQLDQSLCCFFSEMAGRVTAWTSD